MRGERRGGVGGGWGGWVVSNKAISGEKASLTDKKKAGLHTNSARHDNHQLISPEAERERGERKMQRKN